MVGMPWDRDRKLDAETARQVVRAQFPEIDAKKVGLLGEGWDSDAHEIDGRWVFRFAKRRDYDARWLKEVALLDAIAGRLPLPVPVYEFRGQPTAGFPYHFGGYAKLSGRPAMDADLSASLLRQSAAQLGRFLECLHRFDPKTAIKLAVYGPDETDSLEQERRGALTNLKGLEREIDSALYERCRDFFLDPSRMPKEYEGPARLLHSDLLAEHILVEPQEGRVSGIIDWSDACAGDPANDFAGLWVWQGDAFVADAMKEYETAADEGMWDRIRYKGLCIAVGDISYGHLRGFQSHIEQGMRCLLRELRKG